MCTLIALHRVHDELPLIVAANRDEMYARPTSSPTLLSSSPRVVGGRDVEKGGSWLGVNEAGFFVGLTNQRSATPPDPTLGSRGEVVLRALGQRDLDGAVAWLGQLDARAYNSFNLLCGDRQKLWVAYARRELAQIELHPLTPGIWALPNDRLGSPAFPKATRAVELAGALSGGTWPQIVERAQVLLGDHAVAPVAPDDAGPAWLPPALRSALQALCVHTPAYGTRSATLLGFGPSGLLHYAHADGPPCRAPLVARDDLVEALRSAQPSPASPCARK